MYISQNHIPSVFRYRGDDVKLTALRQYRPATDSRTGPLTRIQVNDRNRFCLWEFRKVQSPHGFDVRIFFEHGPQRFVLFMNHMCLQPKHSQHKQRIPKRHAHTLESSASGSRY